jgi:hypothetical protein
MRRLETGTFPPTRKDMATSAVGQRAVLGRQSRDSMPKRSNVMTDLPLSEQEIVDAYIYVFARYLVIRQEHIDIAEEGVDYNVIKFNELGKAEFVNPNLDVAYLEAWFAVDENTPVILEIPKIEGRYYTAQIMDEWAEIVININERNYPEHPYGRYALCLKGSNPEIPEGALRVDLPSKKAKMLARVERQGDDEGAVRLQRSFIIVKVGEPVIEPAVKIPMFINAEPIAVEAFDQPMLAQVLDSAFDSATVADLQQKNALIVADFVAQSEANRATVDAIIKGKAFPEVIDFIRSLDSRGGWSSTRQYIKMGVDFLFRCAANYAGIWWNSSAEVVYYIGSKDLDGELLNGDSAYLIRYGPDELPMKHANAYWSLTMLSLPDYRVVPNELGRYNLNNISELQYEGDGSLRIYLAGELPAGAPESNWLPAPKGRPFTLNHRIYVPKEDVLRGEWYAPPIEKVK